MTPIAGAVLILLCADLAAAGENRKVRLEGEVIDADGGQRLPCRLYVEGPPGSFHVVKTASGQGSALPYVKERPGSVEAHTTISAHPFAVELEPGEYTVVAERGKEYFPARQTVRLADAPVKVTLKLRRWIDMAARGWYSGETHVHRSLDELPNVVLAEDLNVSFPLLYWVTQAFEPPSRGDKSVASDVPAKVIQVDKTHLIWPRNTEYELFTVGSERHTLGAFFVLGHKTVFERGAPPVAPIARQAHQDGGLIELDKHAWPWSMALVPVMNVDLYELANNHMWRTNFGFTGWGEPAPDYMNIERNKSGWTEWGWIDYSFQNYYALLDCGFRLRPTAGTASGVHPVPLGFSRVYVKVDGPLTWRSWLDTLNSGRSFVTTGPMLFVEVNSSPPGSVLDFPGPAETTVVIDARSETPLDRIELVVNGNVARTFKPDNTRTPRGAFRSSVTAKMRFDGSSWVAVRAIERRPGGRIRFAHSSPVFIEIKGKPLRPRKEEVDFLIQRVSSQIVRSKGVLPPEAIEEYDKALEIYRQIARRARP
jgi:hypothetical protein